MVVGIGRRKQMMPIDLMSYAYGAATWTCITAVIMVFAAWIEDKRNGKW